MSIFGPILRNNNDFSKTFPKLSQKLRFLGKFQNSPITYFVSLIPTFYYVLFNDAVINNVDETEFIGEDEELNEEEEETHENDDEDVELSDFN